MDNVARLFETPVVQAVLWLIAAFAVAAIARALAKSVVNRTSLKERLSAGEAEGDRQSYGTTLDYIGNLVFLIVFLMFVPAIFATLGVSVAGEPVLNMLDGIMGFLPNVLAAGIVLGAGLLVARLAKQLLTPLFARIRVDRLQERAGIEVASSARLSNTLGQIVYVLIVIPVIIIALQVLDISAISDPATHMLDVIIGFVPNVIAAAIIIGLGVFVAKLAGSIVTQLIASTGIDGKARATMGEKLPSMGVSRMAGMLVQAIIVVLFIVEGVEILNLAVFAGIGRTVLAYLPNVLAAAVVGMLAVLATGAAGKAMAGGSLARYAPFAQAAIWVLAAFMMLTQLNIADGIVRWGFVIVLTALAVAFALAFGMGGRDFARQTLEGLSHEAGHSQTANVGRRMR